MQKTRHFITGILNERFSETKDLDEIGKNGKTMLL